MGVLKNFELNATERKYAEIKHQQRLVLRAEYWKKMTNPALQAKAEGGHLVNIQHFMLIHNLLFGLSVMSSKTIQKLIAQNFKTMPSHSNFH